jgi:hypothetical protein
MKNGRFAAHTDRDHGGPSLLCMKHSYNDVLTNPEHAEGLWTP